MAFKKILFIPTSNTLEQAGARRLLELASPDSKVEVFEPVYNAHLEAYPISEEETYQRLRDELVGERLKKAEILALAFEARGIKASAAASWDYPLYEAVVRRVLKTEADLVVTEPLEGRAGSLSHSDWRLISACPAAALIVKTDPLKGYENIVAAVDPFHAHAKPSELDYEILEQAKAVQARTHGRLAVLHCFVPLIYMAGEAGAEHLPLDDAERALEAFRKDAVIELVTKAGLDEGQAKLVQGRPDEILEGMAERGEIDLLVMGGLSRGRFRDFIIGSTAERILTHAQLDVLIVKPPGFRSTVSGQMSEELLLNPIYYPF